MTDKDRVAWLRFELVEAVRRVRAAEAAMICRRTPTREAARRNAEKWKWTLVDVLGGYPAHYRGLVAELDEAERPRRHARLPNSTPLRFGRQATVGKNQTG